MRAIAVWFKDTPVGSPRQCADFVGQWREELLASIWTKTFTTGDIPARRKFLRM
jgi:hypothetical protein